MSTAKSKSTKPHRDRVYRMPSQEDAGGYDLTLSMGWMVVRCTHRSARSKAVHLRVFSLFLQVIVQRFLLDVL